MKVLAVANSPVESGLYDPSTVPGGNPGTETPSCMGLPGAGEPPGYLYFKANIIAVVLEDYSVYVQCVGNWGGWTGNGSISGTEFPSRLYVKPQYFEITDPFDGTDAIYSFTMTKPDTHQSILRYDFPSYDIPVVNEEFTQQGYTRVGTVYDFNADTETGADGIAYIAGTAYYKLDRPIYPKAVSFRIPGLIKIVYYTAGANREKGVWYTTNQPGGRLARYVGWHYVDRVNTEGTKFRNDVFVKSGGVNKPAAKIGALH